VRSLTLAPSPRLSFAKAIKFIVLSNTTWRHYATGVSLLCTWEPLVPPTRNKMLAACRYLMLRRYRLAALIATDKAEG
jgi:hypothetical protein